jgi:hypothetical protein
MRRRRPLPASQAAAAPTTHCHRGPTTHPDRPISVPPRRPDSPADSVWPSSFTRLPRAAHGTPAARAPLHGHASASLHSAPFFFLPNRRPRESRRRRLEAHRSLSPSPRPPPQLHMACSAAAAGAEANALLFRRPAPSSIAGRSRLAVPRRNRHRNLR